MTYGADGQERLAEVVQAMSGHVGESYHSLAQNVMSVGVLICWSFGKESLRELSNWSRPIISHKAHCIVIPSS